MIIYDSNGRTVLNITVDDNSYGYEAIMGDHNIVLRFNLAEHVEIPVGAYCTFENARYYLMRPEALKMKHSRNFEYTVTMEAPEARAKIWKFRNTVDGRLKFSLTAKPIEHLQMFVDNMNRRDSGWTVGECIEGAEVLISYDHAFCYDALAQMASELNTEFEFNRKIVSLRKLEYNKSNPLDLSYGRGNGFKPDIGRSNYGDNAPTEILYVQGGTDNIDRSKYPANETLRTVSNGCLLLPVLQTIGYDGEHFEDEDGFNIDSARTYIVDDMGLSIRRTNKELTSLAEDSLDCSEIYPKRVGTISEVVVESEENNFYDIVDSAIPSTLNYEDYLIEGETMTVIFQSGMLAGKEFEVKYIHEAKDGKKARRFEIVPQEIDGQTMPNATFAPKAGDTYAVFHCMLPDAYICDNATKTGASWDMFRQAVKYLFDTEEARFSFTGTLDGLWSKKDWTNIGGKIRLGAYVRFHDDRFQQEGVLVRITGIKRYINNPHSPELTLSNSTVTGSFSTTIRELKSEEVVVEDNHRKALQFTKRRFRDAKETMKMLEEAMLDNFTNSVSPLTVQTMMMLVGDESLQFRFVNSTEDLTATADTVTWNNDARQLTVGASVIQHMTLGIKGISSGHDDSEYKVWSMPAYTSAMIEDGTKKFYLYAKVSDTAQTGEFLLSETAIGMEAVAGYYHLLVGVLNSEYDGERSYVSLYGFSEILPGRITTDRIVSSDGKTFFDLLQGVIQGKIKFTSGSSGLENLEEWKDKQQQIDTATTIANTKNTVFRTQPVPPYGLDDLWADGQVLKICLRAKAKNETFDASDWGLATTYDNTQTAIDGGIVTTGTVRLAGDDGLINSGVTGGGTATDSVRFWAGATEQNKESAPYRVLDDGSFFATKGEFSGYLRAQFVPLVGNTTNWGTGKYTISKKLNIECSSDASHDRDRYVNIYLPSSVDYIGAYINIYDPNYRKISTSNTIHFRVIGNSGYYHILSSSPDEYGDAKEINHISLRGHGSLVQLFAVKGLDDNKVTYIVTNMLNCDID